MPPPATQIAASRNFEVWRQLRSPFELCSSCVGFHTCKWEAIDTDLAGCLICSAKHQCSVETCTDVVQTEDATVCAITGMCVSTHNLVQNTHTDTAMARPPRLSSVVQRNVHTYIDVRVHVAYLLTSKTCELAHRTEFEKLSAKINSQIGLKCAKISPGETIFDAIEQAVVNMKYTRMVASDFDMPGRLKLVDIASAQLTLTIASCCCYMPSIVRGCDLRTLVYGLLYLMRTGIVVHSVTFLPVLKDLYSCLPTESNLTRFFQFKAKHITEIENRFKFVFRTCSRADMRKMGFHESVM